MATYFVGQRVRVKWFRYCFVAPVREGRVLDTGNWDTGSRHDGLNLSFIAPAEIIVELSGGEFGAFLSEQLEPILPDGHRAGDFSFSELMDKCREGEGIPA